MARELQLLPVSDKLLHRPFGVPRPLVEQVPLLSQCRGMDLEGANVLLHTALPSNKLPFRDSDGLALLRHISEPRLQTRLFDVELFFELGERRFLLLRRTKLLVGRALRLLDLRRDAGIVRHGPLERHGPALQFALALDGGGAPSLQVGNRKVGGSGDHLILPSGSSGGFLLLRGGSAHGATHIFAQPFPPLPQVRLPHIDGLLHGRDSVASVLSRFAVLRGGLGVGGRGTRYFFNLSPLFCNRLCGLRQRALFVRAPTVPFRRIVEHAFDLHRPISVDALRADGLFLALVQVTLAALHFNPRLVQAPRLLFHLRLCGLQSELALCHVFLLRLQVGLGCLIHLNGHLSGRKC